MLVALATIVALTLMPFAIANYMQGPDCTAGHRVVDPYSPAALFLIELDELDLVQAELVIVGNYGWWYEGGELRLFLVLDDQQYSAEVCYLEDDIQFVDLETP